jgi:hypothetical protein
MGSLGVLEPGAKQDVLLLCWAGGSRVRGAGGGRALAAAAAAAAAAAVSWRGRVMLGETPDFGSYWWVAASAAACVEEMIEPKNGVFRTSG